MRALHVLRCYLAGIPHSPYNPAAFDSLTAEHLAAARRGLQQRIPSCLAVNGGALDEASAATLTCGMLFEALVGRLFGPKAGGLQAAGVLLRHLHDAVPLAVRRGSRHHESLQLAYCRLLVHEIQDPAATGAGSSASGVTPGLARAEILRALDVYPKSAEFAALLVRLERLGHTAARLRSQLLALCARSPSPQLWALAFAAEAARPGGHVHLPNLFERALTSFAATPSSPAGGSAATPSSSGSSGSSSFAAALSSCVTLWGVYLQHEAAAGRADAARRLFLRALHQCPGSKPLWLRGLRAAAAAMSPREASELLVIAGDKEVRLRTDMVEVMLEAMQEQQQPL